MVRLLFCIEITGLTPGLPPLCNLLLSSFFVAGTFVTTLPITGSSSGLAVGSGGGYLNEITMKLVIIGGGFAGLQLARQLNNKAGIEILLIDKLTYHQFQPLFYQVATAGLEPSNISFPLRKVFQRSKNVRIRITRVLAIHSDSQEVETDTGNHAYDALVIATGTTTNFFGNEQLAALAYPMKSTPDALLLMNRIINNYEDALDCTDDRERQRLMTIVITGAGPTGVELAGALVEMKTKILPKDYPELDFSLMQIYLLDKQDRPLHTMSAASSEDARRYLIQMGVRLTLGVAVTSYDGDTVTLDNGSSIATKTVIWAAGVKGTVPKGLQPDLMVRGNRIRVDRYHTVSGTPNVYAIGDIACMQTALYPVGHPQLASVAKSQASHLAKNLLNQLRGKPAAEYEYSHKGSMATIGRFKAVVDLPNLYLNGPLAWFAWMFLHLILLHGGKNKVQTFISWTYKFFRYDQSLRLADRYHATTREVELIQ